MDYILRRQNGKHIKRRGKKSKRGGVSTRPREKSGEQQARAVVDALAKDHRCVQGALCKKFQDMIRWGQERRELICEDGSAGVDRLCMPGSNTFCSDIAYSVMLAEERGGSPIVRLRDDGETVTFAVLSERMNDGDYASRLGYSLVKQHKSQPHRMTCTCSVYKKSKPGLGGRSRQGGRKQCPCMQMLLLARCAAVEASEVHQLKGLIDASVTEHLDSDDDDDDGDEAEESTMQVRIWTVPSLIGPRVSRHTAAGVSARGGR